MQIRHDSKVLEIPWFRARIGRFARHGVTFKGFDIGDCFGASVSPWGVVTSQFYTTNEIRAMTDLPPLHPMCGSVVLPWV